MLRGGKKIYCLATDDTHRKETCGGGFTMIKADKLEYKEITNALLFGNFYASHGPNIHNLWFENGNIHIDCSEADKIVLSTKYRSSKIVKAEDNKILNSADFSILPDDGYFRITVTDKYGNHANTNAYFTDELF